MNDENLGLAELAPDLQQLIREQAEETLSRICYDTKSGDTTMIHEPEEMEDR